MEGDRSVFVQDSDEDSVATDTTADSEEREYYNVEKILAERPGNDDDGPEYLLKWQGYKLSRATWEPRSHISSDDLLGQWSETKKAVQEGTSIPFDVQQWEDAVARFDEEIGNRQLRRSEKRRRRTARAESSYGRNEEAPSSQHGASTASKLSPEPRGLVDPRTKRSTVVESESEDEAVLVSRAKKVAVTPRQRKGIARRIKRSSLVIQSSSSEGDESGEVDAVMDESEGAETAGETPTAISATVRAVKPSSEQSSWKRKVSNPAKAGPHSHAVSASDPTASAGRPSQSKSTVGPIAHPGATSVATAKHTSSKMSSNTKAAKKLSAQQSRHPAKPSSSRFIHLSIQNRVRKARMEEPAPDPDALIMVDPKTGKTQTATTAPTPKRRPEDIHSAYGRRSPVRERRANHSPPATVREKVVAPPPVTQARSMALGDVVTTNLPLRDDSSYGPRRFETCTFWLQNTCRLSAETCPRAHGAALPKKDFTCFYWRKGICRKPSLQCEFAHADTGQHAPAPSAYKENSELFDKPKLMPSTETMEDDPSSSSKAIQTYRKTHPKDITCHFWYRDGNCAKSAEQCKFAHFDTGVYADRPTGERVAAGDDRLSLVAPRSRPGAPSDMPRVISEKAALPPNRVVGPSEPNPASEPQTKRRQSVSLESISAVFDIVSESEDATTIRINATLEMSEMGYLQRLLPPGATEVRSNFDRITTAADFQTYCAETPMDLTRWPAGNVVAQPDDNRLVRRLAELCGLHASGLIACQNDFTVILYPCNTEEWAFLDHTAALASPDIVLRVRVGPPTSGLGKKQPFPPPSISRPVSPFASVSVLHHLLEPDIQRLLPAKEGKGREHCVFVMVPPNRQAESEVLLKYFHSLKCKVYHSGIPGAWAHFREKYGKSCLVIIHPEVHIWEIPGLHDFLVAMGAGVRVFSLQLQLSPSLIGGPVPSSHCERLFPHGTVWFITDDVFVYHPEKATKLIDAFLSQTKGKPRGAENSKIAARPGVKDWLMNLALSTSTGEHKRQNPRWMMLYEAMCRLCPPEAEDIHNLPNPSELSYLISDPPEQLPSFRGLWEKDEGKATEMMVEWFAGWSALLNVHKYRRFIVCHEPKEWRLVSDEDGRSTHQVDVDPNGWAKRWQHIGVSRPEDLIKKMKK